jgi:hypothetical protein
MSKLVSKLILAALIPGLGWLTLAAHGQLAVRNQGFVPYSDAPINYLSDNLNDPVARLQKRIERGEVRLQYEPKHGYLKSVLEALQVPVSSQALVFSKTSFQYKKISPQTPRALYYNDDVYVGWVQDGKAVEIVSFDPMQGAIFYLLDAQKVERPSFARAELDCTQCHVASGTRGVPGVLLRSIYPNPSGTQATQTDSFITSQQSPLKNRWGGWYVTGSSGSQAHMGNVVVKDPEHPEDMDRSAGANVVNLAKLFDTKPYLIADSDIVAQLVLAHQTQMHNLITLTNYQTRMALYAEAARNKGADGAAGRSGNTPLSEEATKQYEGPADELLRYLLFVDEAPLSGGKGDRITGTSTFAQEFSARGPRDQRGRSLRDFDLRTRIFKYPCSYLIYSEAFDSLPEPAKGYLYHRLLDVLTGKDQSAEFAKLTVEDRRAILDILLATKPGLPEEWREYGKRAAKGEHNPGRNAPGLSVKK